MEEISERTLAKMVETINAHLPKRQRKLKELLNEIYPTYEARDGNRYLIERRELEFIAKHLNEDEIEDFKVPIVFEMYSLGGSVLIYVKDRLHAEFIRRAFGYDRFHEGKMVLHMHEMANVRKVLRTATQVAYGVMV